MDKYHDKYRIPSTRLRSWDYGTVAAYFITICTKNREHFFGEIRNGEMQLSEIGEIVILEWQKSVKMRPDMNLNMDIFMVMPNHIHGIICIGENEYNQKREDGKVQDEKNEYENHFGAQYKKLASIVRGFKIAVTCQAHLFTPVFQWQERYHDYIIRSEEAYYRIEHYILNNPRNWKEDKFYLKSENKAKGTVG